jgi:HD superfamily phosphohydrolase
MNIKDPVYGDLEINEPVLIELLNDPAVLRVKGVMQGGCNSYIAQFEDFSRYDHCVGVMLLIRLLGGSIEEQIAGLLHDISHTAFSHVVDYVYKKSINQDLHEDIKENLIKKSEIPNILIKYGFHLERILDESNFPLLENHSPDICADRIDSVLRSLKLYRSMNEEVNFHITHMVNHNNEIIFDNGEAAAGFARDMLMLSTEIWAADIFVLGYEILAKAIRIALDNGFLTEDDLVQTDKFVWDKLKAIDNKEIAELLDLISPKLKFEVTDETNFDYHITTKVRYVNPKFLENGEIRRAFDIAPELQVEADKLVEKLKNGTYVKISNIKLSDIS